MKRISYVIARLEKLKSQVGDIPVTVDATDNLLDVDEFVVAYPSTTNEPSEPVVSIKAEAVPGEQLVSIRRNYAA